MYTEFLEGWAARRFENRIHEDESLFEGTLEMSSSIWNFNNRYIRAGSRQKLENHPLHFERQTREVANMFSIKSPVEKLISREGESVCRGVWCGAVGLNLVAILN